jgi:hypothetical protein
MKKEDLNSVAAHWKVLPRLRLRVTTPKQAARDMVVADADMTSAR